MASAFVLTLGALITLSPPVHGDVAQDAAKKEALAAMQTWLVEIDAGNYAKSWSDSANSFQKAITSDQWMTELNGARMPLGKSLARKIAFAAWQTSKTSGGTVDFHGVTAQFDSSFENLKYARETVTFEKEADGGWRAIGYLVKPQ
jgi:hypothetical protein